jgi:virulence factor Mce-like protein
VRERGISPVRAGLIAAVLIVVAIYFAFSRGLPFGDDYELRAVFTNATNVKPRQPVRVAGVDVGEVVSVDHPKPGSEMAVVTMRIEDGGRPVHRDAEVKIRPRLFLEGNWFLDLKPGTNGTGELPDGGTIPIQQTAVPVQLGTFLSILQSSTRDDLRTLFREYGTALEGAGARGYNRSIPYWEPAYRGGAIVQEATLGERTHDLSEYVDGAGRVARGLDRNPEQLKALVTDFNTAAGAFAREAGSLEAAIAELPRTLRAGRPALAALSGALPPLRRLAADLRPSVREMGKTVDQSFPFIRQTRGLVSKPELRGLVRDLVPTVPPLARLQRSSTPLFEQVRAMSGCENDVLDAFSNDRIEDPVFPATGKVFEEAPKPLPGVSGESRNGDSNGQWFHILVSAGDYTVNVGSDQFAQAYLPILGTRPAAPERRPPLEPEVPCETQQPPDLRSPAGPGDPVVAKGLPNTPEAKARYEKAKLRAVEWAKDQVKREGLEDELRIVKDEVKP